MPVVDINKLSLVELKALVYDKSTSLNQITKDIELINNKIKERIPMFDENEAPASVEPVAEPAEVVEPIVENA